MGKHFHSHSPTGIMKHIDWNKELLGRIPDLQIAKKLNVAENAVRMQRTKRGIPAYFLARERLFQEWAREREEEQKQKTGITWDYITGFFDGEGSIAGHLQLDSRGGNYHSIRITMVNTNLESLEKIREFIGTGRIFKQNPRGPISKKVCYVLTINGRKILPILQELEKKSIVKKAGLNSVIEYIHRTTENSPRGRLPYKEHIIWLRGRMNFTLDQIAELYGVKRQAVVARLK